MSGVIDRGTRGSVLVAVLILALIVVTMMAMAGNVAVQHRKSEQVRQDRTVAWYAAEGCVAYAMELLRKNPGIDPTTFTDPGGLPNTRLVIESWGGTRRRFRCHARYP